MVLGGFGMFIEALARATKWSIATKSQKNRNAVVRWLGLALMRMISQR